MVETLLSNTAGGSRLEKNQPEFGNESGKDRSFSRSNGGLKVFWNGSVDLLVSICSAGPLLPPFQTGNSIEVTNSNVRLE